MRVTDPLRASSLVCACELMVRRCVRYGRPTPPMPKLEVSDAQVRAVVTKAVDFTNQGLALLYKLGTAQDPKQTAQVRCLVGGAGRVVRQRAGAARGM